MSFLFKQFLANVFFTIHMDEWVYLQGVIGGLVDFVTGVGVVAVATETKEIINR